MPLHRINITEQHYDMVRLFMVASKLPNVRSATEKMIEFGFGTGRCWRFVKRRRRS